MINSQKIKKHEEYKQIAICSYDINKHQLPQGYNLEGISTKDNGFYGEKCAGRYNVSGYTRDDGTRVSSYTRTCGAKHSG